MPLQRPKSSRPPDLGFEPQHAVRWLDPPQLTDTAWRAAISTIFGSYSDKREVEARLAGASIDDRTAEDEIWIDYAADLGDGFRSTYTVARMLAEPSLDLRCRNDSVHPTSRGRILVLGGDEVYPTAKATEYQNRFVGPYAAALPQSSSPHPGMLAIPGNHDWYDGLTSFLRLFCQGRWIGGWKTEQTRSYFAVRLPHRWWLWGIDIQLNASMDQPQLSYFRDTVARKVAAGDSIILCSAIPAWMHAGGGPKQSAWHNLLDFERAVIEPTGARVLLYLSGDDHHYVRYEEDTSGQTAGDRQPPAAAPKQRITAGGGGAFLSATHHLEPELHLDEQGTLARYVRRATYPPRSVSRRYAWTRIWGLPFLNRGFVVLVGGFYLALGWLMAFGRETPGRGLAAVAPTMRGMDPVAGLTRSPTGVVLLFLLTSGLIAFARAPKGIRRWGLGLAHALAHLAAVGLITLLASAVVRSVHATGPAASSVFLLMSLVAGALAGSFVMALYLWASNLAGTHTTEAFSAMRIADYKGFLRMHVGRDGTLTIYPVGIDRVARRTPFVADAPVDAPWFALQGHSTPHLVEEPVTISVARPTQTATTATSGSGTRKLLIPEAMPEEAPQPAPHQARQAAEGALR